MNKEELKKESEEWVKREYPTLEITAVAERYCKAYLAGAEPREKRIEELEKENAELKLKLETLDGQIPWKDIKDKSEVIGKLTDAKRLLKILIEDYVSEPEIFSDGSCEDNKLYNLIKEAEQFLSEVEE